MFFLPPRASEQGNVIGSVRIYNYIYIREYGSTLYVGLARAVSPTNIIIYIYVCVQKKIVIERTRDLIYLKFVATDFFPKIISPSAGENSGDLA